MAGSAITRALQRKGYGNKDKGGILLTPKRSELDLLNKKRLKTGLITTGQIL